MAGFQSPIDIANRACEHCKVPRISSFNESSRPAQELGFAYDKVRLFELRRNMWTFATKRVVLRPADTSTYKPTFPAWAVGTTYATGIIVAYGGLNWVSLIDGNVGNTPGIWPTSGQSAWDLYFGPPTIDLWSGNANISALNPTGLPASYFTGELVYTTPGDGTFKVYQSLIDSNTNNPAAPDAWKNSVSYHAGEVVVYNATNYQSLVDFNLNYTPSTSPSQWTTVVTNPTVSRSWQQLTSVTMAPFKVIYPAGSGPRSDVQSKNVYPLPAGFLKPCPDDPKGGEIPWLGAPGGIPMRDWVYETGMIVSQQTGPCMLRFIADMQDVSRMEPMFCEALAVALAISVAPQLGADRRMLASEYRRVVVDARTANAITVSAVTPPDTEWIAVRY